MRTISGNWLGNSISYAKRPTVSSMFDQAPSQTKSESLTSRREEGVHVAYRRVPWPVIAARGSDVKQRWENRLKESHSLRHAQKRVETFFRSILCQQAPRRFRKNNAAALCGPTRRKVMNQDPGDLLDLKPALYLGFVCETPGRNQVCYSFLRRTPW